MPLANRLETIQQKYTWVKQGIYWLLCLEREEVIFLMTQKAQFFTLKIKLYKTQWTSHTTLIL